MKKLIDSTYRMIDHLGRSLLGFVFPPQCLSCGSLHDSEPYFLCRRCQNKMQEYIFPFCVKCRGALDFDQAGCPVCGLKKLPIKRGWTLTGYDDISKPLIFAFKYHGILPVGYYLSRRLAEIIGQGGGHNALDMVVPVPLHSSRKRKRGFNQSLIISEILADRLDLPLADEAILRIRRTKSQTGLPPKDRRENMRNAFGVRDNHKIEGRHLLLVDDVITTGATSMEAARTLVNAGASAVTLAVLAVAGSDDIF